MAFEVAFLSTAFKRQRLLASTILHASHADDDDNTVECLRGENFHTWNGGSQRGRGH